MIERLSTAPSQPPEELWFSQRAPTLVDEVLTVRAQIAGLEGLDEWEKQPPDDFDPTSPEANEVMKRVYEGFYTAELEARECGAIVDERNQVPGISLYFSRQGREDFDRLMREQSRQYPEATDVKPRHVNEGRTLYELRLASGAYWVDGGCVRVNIGADPEADPGDWPHTSFVLPVSVPIRIEGNDGSLWKPFQPDGAGSTR